MTRSWEPVFNDARERFGSDPFTVLELVEVLRPYVNPMEAARLADRRRLSERPQAYESRRKDEVAVGMRSMAAQLLNNRIKSGAVERLEVGVYRLGRVDSGRKDAP